ncbi:protein MTL1 isoform X2 [Daphnia magna]|uniref:protein MTL1 isoform X2 n=1 Tax=Daphnia magna TaxID=35525 RepID=UPI001E1BACC1|nr:protein MTL1 isoform X2 [Daphnia magna]
MLNICKFSQVALVLLATSLSCAAAVPINSPKKSIFSRSRWDRRTEETTTIRVYQPKYKTLFNFRQLPASSTFPPIPSQVIDSYSTSPPTVTKIPRHPLLVEELSVDPSLPAAATEPSAISFSDSSSSSSSDSTTQSSKPSFSMSNLLRPSNSMTNFFKSLSRNPKSNASPSSTVNPNVQFDMELPSSIMKPPSLVAYPSTTSNPLTGSSSFSLSLPVSEISVPSLSASFFSSTSPHVPKQSVSPGYSPSSAGISPPRGTSIIVAASNPSDDTSLPRVPKSSSTAIHAVSTDSSITGDYSFSYRVSDASTNQDFGHQENRIGNNTQGRYDVALPDGRRQIVDYQVLNNSGYTADVSYVGDIKPFETVDIKLIEPPIIENTTPAPSLITNAKIEENMEFPI